MVDLGHGITETRDNTLACSSLRHGGETVVPIPCYRHLDAVLGRIKLLAHAFPYLLSLGLGPPTLIARIKDIARLVSSYWQVSVGTKFTYA